MQSVSSPSSPSSPSSSSSSPSSLSAGARPLVLAYMAGFSSEALFDRFLRSLRAHYAHDVLVVVSREREAELSPLMDELGVRAEPMSLLSVWRSASMRPNELRYHEFASKCRRPYTHCLVIDGRDTYFEADPFKWFLASKLDVALVQESQSIRQQADNFAWIEGCYGQQRTAAIADNPVICSGSIWMSREAAAVVLRRMEEEITRMIPQCTGPHGLHDQALLNMIHYGGDEVVGGSLPTLMEEHELKLGVIPYGEGPIATVGVVRPEITEAPVRQKDGSIAAIVHQYDRHSFLFDYIEKKVSEAKWGQS